ncbi:MAG: B12-binding domain-containing radical SAM protein [Betaproteobacteria bacterium]
MTDVLIGQAYFLRFDPKLWAARQPYAPLGALYAAACVRAAGFEVALFDAMLAASETEWAEALDRHRPAVAVLYEDSFNYLSKMCLLRMREAAGSMIDAARARGITTVVAGSDASDHPALYLERGATAVVRGEGEVTLPEVLAVLTGRSKAALSDIPGLYFRAGPGGLAATPAREFVRDLDRLPRPAWDLVDVERYRATWMAHHGYFSMNVVTTRGCPYHCNWCAKPIYGQRYAARSPESVADEVAWLRDRFAPDHLWMADDIFGLKPGWIERFAAAVRARRAVTPFKCLLRADQVTPAVAHALAAAGCRTAWIGAESGSARVLDAMEKGIRPEQIGTASRLLHEAGMQVAFFLQFGYPGEEREDIERTLEMVRQCRPDDIGVSVSYPLPGTPFFERVRAELGAKQNWVDSDDLEVMFRATYTPEFYRTLHAFVHAEFRKRKAADAAARIARRPWALRAGDVRRAASWSRHAVAMRYLRVRLDRLERLGHARATPPPLPMLTPEAAAIPSEQPQ